jgi:hypothetical protein
MFRWAAYLAIGFAIFLGVGEAVRNSEQMQYWAFWVVDYIAVLLLLTGGIMVVRGPNAFNRSLLGAAWGFTCAMFYGSFFGHLKDLEDAAAVAQTNAQSAINEPQLTYIIGTMFAVSVIGLVLTVLPREK